MINYDYQILLDSLYEGVYIVDNEKKITYWNQGARRISGFSAEDTVGHFCHDNILNHIDAGGRLLCLEGCPLHQVHDDGEIKELEAYLQHKKGHRIPVKIRAIPLFEKGERIGTVEFFIENMDSNYSLARINEGLKRKLRDKLTGLPNKTHIEQHIKSKLDELKALNIPFGVIIADIDDFEGVNLTYGSALSDDLLILLTESFKHSFRIADMIGRWQNDEYIFIFSGVTNESLLKLCEKIRILSEGSALRNRLFKDIDISVSVGGTLVRKDDTLASIVERVSERLEKAKIKGGNNCVTK